jgi:hypothetical protein
MHEQPQKEDEQKRKGAGRRTGATRALLVLSSRRLQTSRLSQERRDADLPLSCT